MEGIPITSDDETPVAVITWTWVIPGVPIEELDVIPVAVSVFTLLSAALKNSPCRSKPILLPGIKNAGDVPNPDIEGFIRTPSPDFLIISDILFKCYLHQIRF